MADEKREKDQLHYREHAGVHDHLRTLEVLSELEHAGELGQLSHTQQPQQPVHSADVGAIIAPLLEQRL